MADYHPLIARAVAGLDKNTGENRRALYERARTALVAQLRGVNPPLEESEITRERLALEEAIRKVEAESARHARETARPAFIKRAEAPRRDEPAPPPPQDQPASPPAVTARPAAPALAPPRPPARPNTFVQTRTATAAVPQQAQPAPPPPRAESPPPPLPVPVPRPAAPVPAARKPQTLADEALRGFRDAVPLFALVPDRTPQG